MSKNNELERLLEQYQVSSENRTRIRKGLSPTTYPKTWQAMGFKWSEPNPWRSGFTYNPKSTVGRSYIVREIVRKTGLTPTWVILVLGVLTDVAHRELKAGREFELAGFLRMTGEKVEYLHGKDR